LLAVVAFVNAQVWERMGADPGAIKAQLEKISHLKVETVKMFGPPNRTNIQKAAKLFLRHQRS